MKKNKIEGLTFGAIIASMYVVLTLLSNMFGLASGVIQFRLSECLTTLAYLNPACVLGLTVGCLMANIFVGGSIFDIIFGTLATLIGAIGTYYISRVSKKLLWFPPVLSNMIIVPLVLRYAYGAEGTLIYFMLTVGIGEIVTCLILGMLLNKALEGKIKWIEKR